MVSIKWIINYSDLSQICLFCKLNHGDIELRLYIYVRNLWLYCTVLVQDLCRVWLAIPKTGSTKQQTISGILQSIEIELWTISFWYQII